MTNPSKSLLAVCVSLMVFGIPELARAQEVVQCAASTTADFENCATSQFFTEAMQGSLGFGQVSATFLLPSTSVAETAYVRVSAQVMPGGGYGPPALVYSPSLTMTPIGSNGVSLAGLTEAQQEQTWRDYDVMLFGLDRLAPLIIDGTSLPGFPTGFSTSTDAQLQGYLATSQPGIWSTLLARQSFTTNHTYTFMAKFPNGDSATFQVNNGVLSWDFPVAHDINGNAILRPGYSLPVGCPASQNCPHPGNNGQSWPQPPPAPFPPCAYVGSVSLTLNVGTGNGVQPVTVSAPNIVGCH